MSITAPHYRFLKSLKRSLPEGGSLLEIGEANWYGDILPDFQCLEVDASACNYLEYKRRKLFGIAKSCYASLFAPSRIVSVDMNGTPEALRHDLNYPLPMNELFDVVINHGTAEHVFNIAQVFRTMHDHCETGGLMIHDAPFHGWIDHGFYCLQPTLFYDLAAANNYEVVRVVIGAIGAESDICVESREQIHKLAGKIPENALLLVALRKIIDRPFRIPMQGYYAQTISGEAQEAWRKNR